jgi:hypothetical protein
MANLRYCELDTLAMVKVETVYVIHLFVKPVFLSNAD